MDAVEARIPAWTRVSGNPLRGLSERRVPHAPVSLMNQLLERSYILLFRYESSARMLT